MKALKATIHLTTEVGNNMIVWFNDGEADWLKSKDIVTCDGVTAKVESWDGKNCFLQGITNCYLPDGTRKLVSGKHFLPGTQLSLGWIDL